MSSEPDLDALQSQDITEVLDATTPADQDLKNQLGSKKRSHEDMSKDNTASVTEDIDEKKLLPESLTVLSRQLTPPMAPPKTIKYDMLPPTQKPPHSGQSGPANLLSQNQPANTVTGNSETQKKVPEDVKDDDVDEDTDDDDSPESLNSNPANQISAFDWKELDAKYHKQEEIWAAEEQKAFQEFNQLCNVSQRVSFILHQLMSPVFRELGSGRAQA